MPRIPGGTKPPWTRAPAATGWFPSYALDVDAQIGTLGDGERCRGALRGPFAIWSWTNCGRPRRRRLAGIEDGATGRWTGAVALPPAYPPRFGRRTRLAVPAASGAARAALRYKPAGSIRHAQDRLRRPLGRLQGTKDRGTDGRRAGFAQSLPEWRERLLTRPASTPRPCPVRRLRRDVRNTRRRPIPDHPRPPVDDARVLPVGGQEGRRPRRTVALEPTSPNRVAVSRGWVAASTSWSFGTSEFVGVKAPWRRARRRT